MKARVALSTRRRLTVVVTSLGIRDVGCVGAVTGLSSSVTWHQVTTSRADHLVSTAAHRHGRQRSIYISTHYISTYLPQNRISMSVLYRYLFGSHVGLLSATSGPLRSPPPGQVQWVTPQLAFLSFQSAGGDILHFLIEILMFQGIHNTTTNTPNRLQKNHFKKTENWRKVAENYWKWL